MQASEHLYTFLKKCEGYESIAKPCPAGVPTVGWGTTKWDMKTPVKIGDHITPEEADRQLQIEVHRVEDAINSSVKVELTQAEFDALTSLFYNIGTGWCTGYKHKQADLINLLNAGNYAAVPAQLLLFRKDIHGKVWPGLVTRRKWEAQMWLAAEGDHRHIIAATPENGPGVMPQAVAPAKAEKTTTTIAKSPSVKGASVGILAGISAWLDNVFGWSKDTAQQVLDTTNDLGPVQTLVGNLTNHATQIGFGVTVAALVYVLWRRFKAAAEGRSV